MAFPSPTNLYFPLYNEGSGYDLSKDLSDLTDTRDPGWSGLPDETTRAGTPLLLNDDSCRSIDVKDRLLKS